jgi:ABC-type branched-subunit amino acid transport system permease subunit
MSNATAAILGQVIGAALAICLGALVVQFVTVKLASFKPAYRSAFLATFIGYLVNYAIGFIVGYSVIANKGTMTSMVTLLTIVIAFFVQASFYSIMLKSPDGIPLGYGKACIVSLSQFVVAALGIGVISMILVAAGEASR